MALRYQLGYFNILPLYVVLMAVRADYRRAPPAHALGAVAAVARALSLHGRHRLQLADLAGGGQLVLLPLAWQFIFILGFLLAGEERLFAGFAPR